MICASIDIGTNTLLLLIAKVNNGKIIEIICDEHQIARLGEGLNKSGTISDVAILRATRILYDYKNIMKENNVEHFRITATSAMRDAENSNEVRKIFESIIGQKIEIISGKEEARISYIGSIENGYDGNNIILDIGGGSTEVVTGRNDKIVYSKSLQIGAVRITEEFFPDFPSKVKSIEVAKERIRHILDKLAKINSGGNLIAVAGTPTTIAAIDLKLPQYNAHKIHNHRITIERLEEIIQLFIENTSEELVDKYNVHPNRADVILGGALILLEFCKYVGKSEFIVSCKGLRYGLILDLVKNN